MKGRKRDSDKWRIDSNRILQLVLWIDPMQTPHSLPNWIVFLAAIHRQTRQVHIHSHFSNWTQTNTKLIEEEKEKKWFNFSSVTGKHMEDSYAWIGRYQNRIRRFRMFLLFLLLLARERMWTLGGDIHLIDMNMDSMRQLSDHCKRLLSLCAQKNKRNETKDWGIEEAEDTNKNRWNMST